MLKFFFWSLVAANGLLYACQEGHLSTFFPDGREPARMGRQINPGSVKILPAEVSAPPVASAEPSSATPSANPTVTAPATSPATVPVTPPAAPAQAAKSAPALACTEIGNFEPADATRFEQRIAGLALGSKLTRRTVQENARNMVFIPPLGSKEGADKKAGELRRLGITDFFIIQEGPQRWGISLGIFRTDEAARAHLAGLTQKGVQSARLGEFSPATSKIAFQFRGLDAAATASVARIRTEFAKQESRACESAA